MGRTKRCRTRRKNALCNSQIPKDIHDKLYKYLRALGWLNEFQLSIGYFKETGRGVMSKKRSFRSGDNIISLPEKSLIAIHTLESDSEFKTHFKLYKIDENHKVSFQSLLAVYIIYQEHRKHLSSMAAYIDTLPKEFSMPYFCTKEELNLLPDDILEHVITQNRTIRENHSNIQLYLSKTVCSCCSNNLLQIYNLAKFKWAYFVVNSRSVFVDSSLLRCKESFFNTLISSGSNLALAPFLDLFNHSDKVGTKANMVPNEKGKFEYMLDLEKTEPIKRYSEIFINYGLHSNRTLMLEYGFILANNCHDCFCFTLADIESFMQEKQKVQGHVVHRNKFKFIREHNLHDEMFVEIDSGISHNLLVVLHLFLREASHFPNILSRVAFGPIEQFEGLEQDVNDLCRFKVLEYRNRIRYLEKLTVLSASGKVCFTYLRYCIEYLESYIGSCNIIN